MGWTTTFRPKGQSHLDFFKSEFDCENEHGKWEVLAAAGHLDTVYLAMKITRKDGSKAPFVLGVVCLIRWYNSDRHYNFGYKDMSEDMGPCEAKCPRRILDLLSPLDAGQFDGKALEWATTWRQRCEEHLAKRTKLKLRKGMILRTDHKIPFARGKQSWGKYDTFICTNAKRLHFDALWPMDFVGENGKATVGRTAVRFSTRDPLLEAEVLTCEWWEVFDGTPGKLYSEPPTEQAEASPYPEVRRT